MGEVVDLFTMTVSQMFKNDPSWHRRCDGDENNGSFILFMWAMNNSLSVKLPVGS